VRLLAASLRRTLVQYFVDELLWHWWCFSSEAGIKKRRKLLGKRRKIRILDLLLRDDMTHQNW